MAVGVRQRLDDVEIAPARAGLDMGRRAARDALGNLEIRAADLDP